MRSDAEFTSLRYEVVGRKAYITLDRPERLNAIDHAMPGEIHAAVDLANEDPGVHVIVLGGEGLKAAGSRSWPPPRVSTPRWSGVTPVVGSPRVAA